MRIPFKKDIGNVETEGAHGGSGKRQLLLSSIDNISGNIEALTKGFLAPQGVFDWHSHDNIDEFFIVLQGTGMIEFEDGQKIAYRENDLIYMPAPMRHRITNTGNVDSIFYFIRIKN
ncbi:MAG: cupin domain-containing protein [Candidatus Peribacteria bacterium]|jgi:mannose-6-phosphate isomerase-like protein (cupin superfamily)|nr:cupin domain-containing protein [Candidatus Peribacteria bacterium]